MHAAHRFPVFDVGEKHAGADDVVEGGAGLASASRRSRRCAGSDLRRLRVVCADGTCAREMHRVPTRTAREKPMMGS